MLKKWIHLTLTTLATAGVLLAGMQAPAAANHHKSKHHGSHGCGEVTVSGKMAYLKMNPAMGAQTLRMAHHGEKFMVVKDKMGHPHHWDGWWLVRSSNGYRYWAHHSMLSCAGQSGHDHQHASNTSTHDHASHHGGTAHNDHSHASHHTTAKHNPHKMGCASVSANGTAYLKMHPMMGAKTLGMAHKGDHFMTLKNPNGHPVHANGWFLVKNSKGYRYYIHNSMIKCQE